MSSPGRKVAIPDSWFSRGYVECSFGQVMLHFRSFGHIMLQESSQCLHTQTESKLLPWPFYASFGQIMVQLTKTSGMQGLCVASTISVCSDFASLCHSFVPFYRGNFTAIVGRSVKRWCLRSRKNWSLHIQKTNAQPHHVSDLVCLV
jgi:hypothetical protein